jgi:hypothetical protein
VNLWGNSHPTGPSLAETALQRQLDNARQEIQRLQCELRDALDAVLLRPSTDTQSLEAVEALWRTRLKEAVAANEAKWTGAAQAMMRRAVRKVKRRTRKSRK